jgi:hypothetical protein
MRWKLFSTLAVTWVAVSACGGGGGDAGDGGQQREVADMFIEFASEQGIELDRDCVEEAAESLSDDDAERIVEAGTDGAPELSPEAEAVGDAMFSCADASSYVDSIVAQFEGDDSIDADCLREQFEGLTTPDEIAEKVTDAALACSG